MCRAIWISTSAGLYRYDGLDFKSYIDSSLKSYITCLAIDTDNIIWFGTYGSGIVKFNPVTNTFTSFHHSNNASTLLNDTITCITKDHLDNIWIGTYGGPDKLDRTTGKFTHYNNNNASSLSRSHINTIYEDKRGVIWIGCGFAFRDTSEKNGGLNRLDPSTGKFTRYFNKPGDTCSLINNNVMTIFEDSKENFWVGTGRSGLHIMDRKTGKFIRISFDHSNPFPFTFDHSDPLSSEKKISVWDVVTFINEDNNKNLWIGSLYHGINCYNSVLKNIIHFGNTLLRTTPVYYKEDTISGFRENDGIFSVCSKDGTFWVANEGNLYKITQPPKNIPYYDIEAGANSFYEENDSILWIATGTRGLDKRNIKTGKDIWITNANGNSNVPPDHDILGLRADADSDLWIATYTGLYKLNLKNDIFTRYLHDVNKSNSLAGDTMRYLYIGKQDLWLGFRWHGLDKMNIQNGTITHYSHSNEDSNSITNNFVSYIVEDKNNDIWIATTTGLDRLNQNTNKFTHYLKQSEVLSICIDTDGMIWAGTTNGFYYFDVHKNSFAEYINQNAPVTIANVLHILEDNQHNLWVTTSNAILKISRKTNSVNVYSKDYGVHYNGFYNCDNYKLKNGQLLIGDPNGYYLISPLALDLKKTIVVNFTGFKIGDEEVQLLQDAVFSVNEPVSQAKKIKLNYKQNIFSFNFSTTDYANSGKIKYLVMLENYDNAWRDIGTEHKAYFFNVPPGNYIFHVKAINPDGVWIDKSISIIISPPWWSTWWFRMLAVVTVIAMLYALIRWRVQKKFRLQLEQAEKEKQLAMLRQKTSELETQALRAQMDQVLKLQQMRTRIASDLHDDIGSTLTSISYYSELVKMQLKEDGAPLKSMLDKIGGSARNTVKAMSDIVWIINPKNDTTENLVNRMRQYAAEMLVERNIQYMFNANEEIGKLELNMQQRKNVYLIYKEAVHNAVKYAQCSKIEIDFSSKDHEVSLNICDNGNGFDVQHPNDGNGLINMKKRAEEINAEFEICSTQNKGTRIRLTCKIT